MGCVTDTDASADPGWNLPLSVGSEQDDLLSPAAVKHWITVFLAIGLLARLLRYSLAFPLWVDESFLAASLLQRGYGDLLQPLEYYQVCPLLILWVQLSVVKVLGFSEYSLRAFPLVCGLASLALFRHLAGRLLGGTALVLAVAFFAVSYPGIRYAAEAKQYGIELFVSLAWLTMAVQWRRRPGRQRWLWLLALSAPIGVGLSYTAIFVGSGISLFLAYSIRGVGARRAWTAWAVYTVLLLAAFALLFLVSANNQAERSQDFLTTYWQDGFLPITKPLKVPLWLLENHTSELLAYPVGGERGGSALTAICCAAAVVVLWRRRQFQLLVLGLSPLVLVLGASAIHRYPYGQMTKFQFFLAPVFCAFAGLGAASLLLRRWGRWTRRRTPLLVVLAVLAAIGVGTMLRDLWLPAKSMSDMRARDFARWFWFTIPQRCEVVCLKADLQRSFAPKSYEYGFSSMYLCNQWIYSQRRARGQSPNWNRISIERPLWCVDYRASNCPVDEPAKAAWLAEMQSKFRLIGQDCYPLLYYDKRDRRLVSADYLDVYKFVPKSD